jgi:hypothetical protein
MKTTSVSRRLLATLTAGALLATTPTAASAEEPYQRVTVAELKRIMKQREEEQKSLEATPEYQAKKRLEEESRKRREQEKLVAKESELRLKMLAAELERVKLENRRQADPPATNDGSGGGSGGTPVTPTVLDVPRLMVDPRHVPSGWFGKSPSTNVPRPPGAKPAPGLQTATRIR